MYEVPLTPVRKCCDIPSTLWPWGPSALEKREELADQPQGTREESTRRDTMTLAASKASWL